MITQQLKDAWLAELRDPTNTQARCTLFNGAESKYSKLPVIRELRDYIAEQKCMCAMGCLIVAHAKNSTDKEYLHRGIQDHLDDNEAIRLFIIHMNDVNRKSFSEIADWIEANVEAV